MSELPVLGAEDQRILGSLMEKQTTVPATYPLSANALTSACNQTSSRDPVTDYDQQTVERSAKSLKERGLLRIVWSDTGRRTLKYHQILDEQLGLQPDERALLTVLLLRGEQAPGELLVEGLVVLQRPAPRVGPDDPQQPAFLQRLRGPLDGLLVVVGDRVSACLLYTSPSPRD